MNVWGKRNTTHLKMSLVLLVMVFLLSACNLGSSTDQPQQTEATPNQSLTTTEIPENQSEPLTPEAEVEPEPQPTAQMVSVLRIDGTTEEVPFAITSYKQLLEEKISSGEWTEGEGLIQLLKLFTSENSLAEVPEARLVVSHEGTDIIHWSRDFIMDETNDPAQIEEIKRQLAKLFPDQETLDLISQPADAAAMSGAAKTAMLSLQTIEATCQTLAANGFDESYYDGEHCYVYDEAQANGQRYRLYYPTWWRGDDAKKLVIDAALLAMLDSASTFSNLGNFKDVNMMISLLPDPDDSSSAALQFYTEEDEVCPVTLFPNSGSSGFDYFKQVIAHELFHCFQDWNFTTEPYQQNAWWMEGSADYFSNVVYPSIDAEWDFLGQFDRNSLTKTLQQMDYENFLFFQYAANQYGDIAIIDLLRMLGEGGGSADSLANYQSMETTFQDFVVAYVGAGIQDSSGNIHKFPNASVIRNVRIEGEGEEAFSVRAFLPARYTIEYEKEKRFLQEPETDGEGHYSTAEYDLRLDPASWSALPPEIRSTCTEDLRYILVETTTNTNGDYEFKAIVNEMEKAVCDPCLLGVWEVDNDSFEEFILGVMQSSDEAMPSGFVLEIDGHYYTEFNEDGEILFRRDGLSIGIGADEAMVVTTIIDSQGSGIYTADGEIMKVYQVTDYVNKIEAKLNGVPFSTSQTPGAGTATIFGQSSAIPGVENDNQAQESSGSYVCTEETLTLDQADYGEILFNRVEKIMPTPVPTASP